MTKLTEALRPHEIQALQFLSLGPDRIASIDDEATLAAMLCFCDLANKGLVAIDREPNGSLITILPAGRAALES